MKEILVVYLISIYDNKNCLEKFIKHYQKFNAGCKHKLLICFKNFTVNDPILSSKFLRPVDYKPYIDSKNYNDFDWGSYKRIASEHPDKIIFFMNCHSYPIVNNWLKLFKKNFTENVVLGPGGSYESLTTGEFKNYYKNGILKSFINSISNFFYFPLFPNPHLRSNCFMINATDFLLLKFGNKYKFKKKGTWIKESGRNSMYRQLKNLGYEIYIVNSDGNIFDEKKWKFSRTFCLGNQEKLIISDKFSRKYESSQK